MGVDEWTYNDECAKDIPAPERACAKGIIDAAALELIADSCRKLMVPYQWNDTECKPGEEEEDQAVMHSLFAVSSAGDEVDVCADGRHNNDAVDAESDN